MTTSSLVPTSSHLVPDEPETPRPLVPSYRTRTRDEPLGRTPTEITRDEVDDWQQRLQAAVAKTIATRQARRDQRAQFQAARTVGLARRHAAKLAPKETR